jgi:hypothetical protein
LFVTMEVLRTNMELDALLERYFEKSETRDALASVEAAVYRHIEYEDEKYGQRLRLAITNTMRREEDKELLSLFANTVVCWFEQHDDPSEMWRQRKKNQPSLRFLTYLSYQMSRALPATDNAVHKMWRIRIFSSLDVTAALEAYFRIMGNGYEEVKAEWVGGVPFACLGMPLCWHLGDDCVRVLRYFYVTIQMLVHKKEDAVARGMVHCALEVTYKSKEHTNAWRRDVQRDLMLMRMRLRSLAARMYFSTSCQFDAVAQLAQSATEQRSWITNKGDFLGYDEYLSEVSVNAIGFNAACLRRVFQTGGSIPAECAMDFAVFISAKAVLVRNFGEPQKGIDLLEEAKIHLADRVARVETGAESHACFKYRKARDLVQHLLQMYDDPVAPEDRNVLCEL